MNDFEITKREVLVSVIIVSIMLLIGIVIHGNINDQLMLEYQKYNTALQIENDTEIFAYGMRTNIGNAFVYGDLKAVDPVTYPEINGEYSYVEKVKEKYTKHYRTVTKTRTDANGKTHTYTEIEEYWTWDAIDSWSKCSTKITFLPAFTASLERSSYDILIASAAAVASSSIEQFEMLKPVKEEIIVW